MKLNLHTDVSLRYKIDIVRNKKIIPATEWREHMITDAALDAIGAGTRSSTWCGFLASCILGEAVSPTPVRRDSGAVTLSQSGTTVIASSSFFSAADVGRLIKYGTGSSGSEVYITAFTSATQVTVGTSLTQAATVATIWYVNTAALVTPITGLTWSKDPGASNNFNTPSTAGSVATVTSQTVLISSALASPKTVTEIAFNENTTNSNVFDRDIVTPSVGLLAGDQARVTVQLVRNYSSITPVSTSNVGTGCDTSGQYQIETLLLEQNGGGISYFDSNGNGSAGSGTKPLDPPNTAQINIITGGVITFGSFNMTSTTSRTGTVKSLTNAAYGTGNRYRDSSATATISQANGTIYGMAFTSGFSDGATGSFPCHVTFKFTTPFTKSSLQTLVITVRKSWSRVLIN